MEASLTAQGIEENHLNFRLELVRWLKVSYSTGLEFHTVFNKQLNFYKPVSKTGLIIVSPTCHAESIFFWSIFPTCMEEF
jgi:hypothetical protein